MPAVLTSGTVQVGLGDSVRLPMDFGNLRQLVAGAEVVNGVLVLATTIASFDVVCTGMTVSKKQLDYPYQVSAVFTALTRGKFDAVFTVVMNDPDATQYKRTGVIEVL